MPRVARRLRPGERHHVTNRTSRKNPAFLDDRDRSFFLWLLSGLHERFELEVEAFCLMTNHYHLLLQTDVTELARGMHRVGFLYTQYFNNRHGFDGPLFSSRFYSSPVNDPTYHANAVRYIHRNPLAIDARMNLASYQWSSHGTYLGRRPRHWVVTAPALSLFDGSRAVFSDFVENENNDVWVPALSDIHGVVAAVLHTSIADVVRYVARQPNEPLELFFLLAADLLTIPTTEIARYAGVTASTASRTLKRARTRQTQDLGFKRRAQQATEKLGTVPSLPTWWTGAWEL